MKEAMSDEEVVARIRQGEPALFEVIMRRHNSRLYRVVRGVLGQDADVEDVMQQAYLSAYLHLDQFAGQALFATWLTRIAVHEALRRARRSARIAGTIDVPGRLAGDAEDPMERISSADPSPEHQAFSREMADLVDVAMDTLPDGFRSVFVMRDLEGLSTRETAECLDIAEDTVKTRLLRARRLLRRHLAARIGSHLPAAYTFHATRCDRVVAAVLARLPSEDRANQIAG